MAKYTDRPKFLIDLMDRKLDETGVRKKAINAAKKHPNFFTIIDGGIIAPNDVNVELKKKRKKK